MIDPISAKTPAPGVADAAAPVSSKTSAADESVPLRAAPTDIVDPVKLSKDLKEARKEAEAFTAQLRDGAKANAAAANAAKLEMIRVRLKALRMAAVAKAAQHDSEGARKISEEAARVARDVGKMRSDAPGTASSAASGSGAGTDAASAAAGQAPTAEADSATAADAAALDASVDALIQMAREIISIARKAARPESEDERAMTRLRDQTGFPDMQTDAAAGVAPTAKSGDGTGIDVEV